MNNKGFAITTILYGLLIMFLLVVTSLISMLSVYKDRLSILIDAENGARDIINNTEPIEITYAVYNSETKTLTFYKTTKEILEEHTANNSSSVYTGFEKVHSVPWEVEDVAGNIKRVIFEGEIIPSSTKGWFKGLVNCEEIINLEKLNISKVTDMSEMFWQTGLNVEAFKLDLSSWDVSKVNNCTNFILSSETRKITLPQFTKCSIE